MLFKWLASKRHEIGGRLVALIMNCLLRKSCLMKLEQAIPIRPKPDWNCSNRCLCLKFHRLCSPLRRKLSIMVFYPLRLIVMLLISPLLPFISWMRCSL